MRETDGTNKVLDLIGYLNDFVSMSFCRDVLAGHCPDYHRIFRRRLVEKLSSLATSESSMLQTLMRRVPTATTARATRKAKNPAACQRKSGASSKFATQRTKKAGACPSCSYATLSEGWVEAPLAQPTRKVDLADLRTRSRLMITEARCGLPKTRPSCFWPSCWQTEC